MKAIITAGGRGTRLRPITWNLNKHLIPLANEPMLANALKKVAEVGIVEVAINVNPGEVESMRAVFGDGSTRGLQLTYLEQEGGACGVGQILYSAREWIGEDDVLLYFGDNVVLGSLQQLVDKFVNEQLDASFAFVEVTDPERFGVPEFDSQGSLIAIREKPSVPPSNLAQTGLYLYKMPVYLQAFANIVPSARGEYEIADINTFIVQNGNVGYQIMVGWWKDTGTPEALLEGNQLLLNEITQEEATIDTSLAKLDDTRIQGRVKIGKDCIFGEDVLIRGPVVIGDNVYLDHAFIGPHTTLGSGVRVSGAHIQHSIIMEGAQITADTMIVDSIIGKNAVISNERHTLPHGKSMVVGENSQVEI
ncbi:glucose-1-phosphate thymidylyltransferase [Candidatus Uhrbacteria bacterium CG10_big_fil_rev_8_21_14_0_10_50_16]|uniref:Glucose-1-phosphate thymidylyltransferase n=1 Tax=Candidatus Uhrbacteria bacterium CG10_big_fil_rev_8_21_14_0_10_50_16 TaxID=1975039 RepID=A0A2H0RNT8_9BACT|nr:MAG: glucose-1-phosphate thymidylyltransferase [Candidatus Uhrbacteria bacterium CG10_big_fil_rev_8_21_14_0_10_50_16]